MPKYMNGWLAPVFSSSRYYWVKLAGSSQCVINKWKNETLRMCSKMLTKSPMKMLPEEPPTEVLRSRSLVDQALNILPVNTAKSPRKEDTNSQSNTAPQPGLSFLPASMLLQKSFDVIASENAAEKRKRSRPFTVSIEGNIGSGKSTFLQYFSAQPGVSTYQEPLDLWTNCHGHNLLGRLYEDPTRWSFLFQSYVQLTRLNIHLQQDDKESPVKLIERSLQNNRYCFVESGHDAGDLAGAEYSVLCEYYNLLDSNLDIGIDLIVYLRSTPEVVHERMLKRGRAEEEGVPLDYLKQVHHYYENWLVNHKPKAPPAPVLIIDADKDLEAIKKEYNERKAIILGKESL